MVTEFLSALSSRSCIQLTIFPLILHQFSSSPNQKQILLILIHLSIAPSRLSSKSSSAPSPLSCCHGDDVGASQFFWVAVHSPPSDPFSSSHLTSRLLPPSQALLRDEGKVLPAARGEWKRIYCRSL